MDVEYEVTIEDVAAFHRYHLKHLPAPQRRIDPLTGLFVWIICCLFSVVVIGAFAFRIDSYFIPLLLAAWIGGATALIVRGWYAKWSAYRIGLRTLQNSRDARHVLGWCRVLIDAQGLQI